MLGYNLTQMLPIVDVQGDACLHTLVRALKSLRGTLGN